MYMSDKGKGQFSEQRYAYVLLFRHKTFSKKGKDPKSDLKRHATFNFNFD